MIDVKDMNDLCLMSIIKSIGWYQGFAMNHQDCFSVSGFVRCVRISFHANKNKSNLFDLINGI